MTLKYLKDNFKKGEIIKLVYAYTSSNLPEFIKEDILEDLKDHQDVKLAIKDLNLKDKI